MYPFYVLGVRHTVSDEEVAERYHQLIQTYPPDVAPEAFIAIRAAYEALQTKSLRVQTRLFHWDKDCASASGFNPSPHNHLLPRPIPLATLTDLLKLSQGKVVEKKNDR